MTKIQSVLKMIKMHQHAKFVVILSMHSQDNAWKPLGWTDKWMDWRFDSWSLTWAMNGCSEGRTDKQGETNIPLSLLTLLSLGINDDKFSRWTLTVLYIWSEPWFLHCPSFKCHHLSPSLAMSLHHYPSWSILHYHKLSNDSCTILTQKRVNPAAMDDPVSKTLDHP